MTDVRSNLKADHSGGFLMKGSTFSLQPAEPVVMWTGAWGLVYGCSGLELGTTVLFITGSSLS